MKKIFIFICILFSASESFAQSYMFDSIPFNLKKRANAIVRTDQCLYTIKKPGSSTEKRKKAITLINEASDIYRFLRVYYNKDSKVLSLRGAIYDENGEIIKLLGTMDVFDMSAIPGGSFYTEDRVKLLYFPIYKYPYTIEYEYEIEYSSILSYPSWYFHEDPKVSVEKSGIQFVVPKNLKLRYLSKNLTNPVDSIIKKENVIYTWQEENIPAVGQGLSLRTVHKQPVLYTAPLDFEYGGYRGSMESWDSFGSWIYDLNNGRDSLPSEDIEAVRKITTGVTDIRAKARLIYEYMQSKTRYVSIQIGIGGFRTAEASSVSGSGFGDCKALVNYTRALLKVSGIRSYFTLVRAGEDGTVYKNFVDNQFNHAILCIPIKKDSVWLDCTSQTLPFNYLGDFTDDRYALLITPEGGKLVKTPSFSKKENLTEQTGQFYMNILGSSSGTLTNKYTGYNYGIASSSYGLQSDDEMKRDVSSSLGFSSVEISSVKYSEEKSEEPIAKLSSTLSINDFATVMGERIYFSPSIRKIMSIQDFPVVFDIREAEIIRDSVSYNLPLGYGVEYLPENVSVENEYGKYIYNLSLTNDKITCKRLFEVNKSIIPLERFSSFRDFLNNAARKDKEQIILVKNKS